MYFSLLLKEQLNLLEHYRILTKNILFRARLPAHLNFFCWHNDLIIGKSYLVPKKKSFEI